MFITFVHFCIWQKVQSWRFAHTKVKNIGTSLAGHCLIFPKNSKMEENWIKCCSWENVDRSHQKRKEHRIQTMAIQTRWQLWAKNDKNISSKILCHTRRIYIFCQISLPRYHCNEICIRRLWNTLFSKTHLRLSWFSQNLSMTMPIQFNISDFFLNFLNFNTARHDSIFSELSYWRTHIHNFSRLHLWKI